MMKVPAPAIMHFPRSFLEVSAIDLSHASRFMQRAAETQDHVERLKLIASMYIGG